MANDVRVASEPLKDFTRSVFVRRGVSEEDAQTEAEVLVWANLRGVDSHGVLRIPLYMGWIDAGIMNPNPNVRVLNETPATLLIEADRALGPVVTVMAMGRVIEKAKQIGIGWAVLRNNTHQGAMAYYSLMAAKEDMAGIAIVCSPPNMAPVGARAPGVHNSPISIAVPGNKRGPLVLDMATSVAAGGKVSLARDKGIDIPLGWALDDDGNPTTDPSKGNLLLPSGGPKGSGLAMMFECLASLMAGNPLLGPSMAHPESPLDRGVQNSVLAAIDIGTFTDAGGYRDDVDELIEGIKGLPKAEGTDEIFVPGEPEDRVYQDRSKNGIPLPEGTVANLREVAKKYQVELPEGL